MKRHGSGHDLAALRAGPFHVSHTVHPAGLELGLHEHDRACFHFVASGVYAERTVRRRFDVPQGGVLLKPPQTRHCNRFDREARSLRIDFPAALYPPDLPHAPRPIDDPSMVTLSRAVLRELDHDDDAVELAVHGLCLQLLAGLSRSSPCGRDAGPAAKLCEAYLRDRFRRPVCLTTMARELGYSRTYLATAFRRDRGMTLGEFVRRLRVAYAIERLEKTGAPLSDVAADAGFADQSHLTRTFRRLTGTTPGRWRSRNRG